MTATDRPGDGGDMTTAQDVVDSAAERKSPEWVHENIERVLRPLKVVGIDASPEDVDLPETNDDA